MDGVSEVPDMDDLLDKLEKSSEDFVLPNFSDHNGRTDIKPVLYPEPNIRICSKNSDDNAIPGKESTATERGAEEQVQIVADVVGSVQLHVQTKDEKSDSEAQKFIAHEPILEMSKEQIQIVEEMTGVDLINDAIDEEEEQKDASNEANIVSADLQNETIPETKIELSSINDQQNLIEPSEAKEEEEEKDDLFDEIDRMQKMIDREKKEMLNDANLDETLPTSLVLESKEESADSQVQDSPTSHPPLICANEQEIMTCSLVDKKFLTNDEEAFLSAKSDVIHTSESSEVEDAENSEEISKINENEEFEDKAKITGECDTENIAYILSAESPVTFNPETVVSSPPICATNDQVATCSLVEKEFLSENEKAYLTGERDETETNKPENLPKSEDIQNSEENLKYDEAQLERQKEADEGNGGNREDTELPGCSVPPLDRIHEKANENESQLSDSCNISTSVAENIENAKTEDSCDVPDKNTESPNFDIPTNQASSNEETSKEISDHIETQSSTSYNNCESEKLTEESSSEMKINSENVITQPIEAVANDEETRNVDDLGPSTSAGISAMTTEETLRRSVVASTHDISIINKEFKLTESELQLAKVKPYWIPDEDCQNCMLCSSRFTIVNRRHHCRSCGRVLCSACCAIRRMLPYMSETEKKQRVCAPCNKTLDRIEEYEKFLAEQNTTSEQSNNTVNTNSDDAQQSQIDTAASIEPKKIALPQPVRKKSVLKVRSASFQIESESGAGIPPTDSENGSDTNKENPPMNSDNSESIPSTSNQSNVINPENPATVPQPQSKRSVTFLDGVNPGSDAAMDSLHRTSDKRPGEDGDNANRRKPQKIISRRAMEKRVEEEQTSLLFLQPEYLFLTNPEVQLTRTNVFDITEQINGGERVGIAIKRNLHAIVQRTHLPSGESTIDIWCVSTRGFHFIGVDELVLVWESRPPKQEENMEEKTQSESRSETENTGFAESADLEELEQQDLIDILGQIEEVFTKCLTPTEDTLDDRMGIRRCVGRMAKMYSLSKGSLAGIEASALLFHRPQGQMFHGLAVPSTPFLIGTLLKRDEVSWAIAIPNRVLYALGKQTSYYPIPLVNRRHRSPIFDTENTHGSVLKVFNDFRNWNYRMAKLPGSYVSLSDSKTHVSLPDWALDELRQIVETNRNMVGWALDFNDRADSHLVCQHNDSSDTFQTHIFASHGTTRQITGATFVIFDGALKSSTEKFVISVVEDGVVVRMQADTMTELVKSLLSGEDFRLESPNMEFCVEFSQAMKPSNLQGALISLIDGENLTGKFQYGLVLSRQFRSQYFFLSLSEWALRLSAVINMDKGKFPSALQPKFFEVCEQLVVTISATLEPFVPSLVKNNQRSICLRFQVTDETACYKTNKWSDQDDEMTAQHYMWTSILDEQMVPFLYSLCARVPNGLHIEMHMAIISVRPLPIGTRDIG